MSPGGGAMRDGSKATRTVTHPKNVPQHQFLILRVVSWVFLDLVQYPRCNRWSCCSVSLGRRDQPLLPKFHTHDAIRAHPGFLDEFKRHIRHGVHNLEPFACLLFETCTREKIGDIFEAIAARSATKQMKGWGCTTDNGRESTR
jgi:hypothetical protein